MAKTQNFIDEAETPGIFTLSSGVKVKLKTIPSAMSQDVFTKLLKNAKFDKKGNLVESDDPQKNIELLERMNSYYATLIAFGATLEGEPEDYYGEKIDKRWLKQLIRAGYDFSNYDLNDPEDIEFLFLRYQAFASQEDWALLQENVLNLPT